MNRDKPSVNLVEQPAIINIIMHAIGKNEQIEEHLILPVKHAIFALVRNHIPIPIEILIQIRAASKDAQVELDALKKSIESSPPVRSL